ncbi:hypothetical protein [Lactiplantibacillus plantarum]|uniref:hypothetical protein n=1 Tax=Lactiplantibacillus plantarum TaxID=1590 RepID=UPI001BABCB4A|nr:hypothetical protein [Lactiplantibacillus plantarum]MBS0954953.1 hypothetical protein [Lactiplantibacillus plantarum]
MNEQRTLLTDVNSIKTFLGYFTTRQATYGGAAIVIFLLFASTLNGLFKPLIGSIGAIILALLIGIAVVSPVVIFFIPIYGRDNEVLYYYDTQRKIDKAYLVDQVGTYVAYHSNAARYHKVIHKRYCEYSVNTQEKETK